MYKYTTNLKLTSKASIVDLRFSASRLQCGRCMALDFSGAIIRAILS